MKQKIILLAILFSFGMSNLHAQQLKGDPWIFYAYQELYNRQPNAWELNIKNYNAGSWNNYDELRRYVKMYQISLRNNNLTVSTTTLASGNVVALFNQNGRSIAANLISQDGGGIIASGGGNIIASGHDFAVNNSIELSYLVHRLAHDRLAGPTGSASGRSNIRSPGQGLPAGIAGCPVRAA